MHIQHCDDVWLKKGQPGREDDDVKTRIRRQFVHGSDTGGRLGTDERDGRRDLTDYFEIFVHVGVGALFSPGEAGHGLSVRECVARECR